MNRFGPGGDLSHIGATAGHMSADNVPEDVLGVTQVVPATEVRVGDGMWHTINADRSEDAYSSGRDIDDVVPIVVNGQPGRRLLFGPWAAEVYNNQQVRITKRTLLNDEG